MVQLKGIGAEGRATKDDSCHGLGPIGSRVAT